MPKPERILWDSCIIIDLLQRSVDHGFGVLEEYVELGLQEEIEIIVSTLAMAEVVKLHDPTADDADAEETIRRFFDNPFVLPRAADRRVCERARSIARTTGVAGPDAVHIATAVLTGVPLIHSRDQKMLRANGRVPGRDGLPIRIEISRSPKPPNLFSSAPPD